MSKETINIEKLICKDAGILKMEGEVVTAKILDIELDPIDCSFHYDRCVQLDTKGYTYITLSLDNLRQLKRLITEAEEYFDEYYENE